MVYKHLKFNQQACGPDMSGITGSHLVDVIAVAMLFDRLDPMMAVQPHLTSGSALMMSMWILGMSPSWTQIALGASTPSVPSTSQVLNRYILPSAQKKGLTKVL